MPRRLFHPVCARMVAPSFRKLTSTQSTPSGKSSCRSLRRFALAGTGHARWNAGGKRGVYRHLANNPDRSGQHPTEKPRRLMAEILGDSTNAGETVLDPFMGSGTTGVAAVQMARPFIGIERHERYFKLACKRIEDAQRQGDMFVGAAA